MNHVHGPEPSPPNAPPADLSRVDLNLLVAFDAIARAGSVTAAAARLGVTQSALSHALRRMRELLKDPLWVRGRSGMVLTPRGAALVVPLRSGLDTLGRALSQPPDFDARTARRAFTLATLDLFDVLVVPRLLERIRREAEGIDLTLVPMQMPRLAEQLETGEVDAAIVPQVEEATVWQSDLTATGFVRRVLLRDRHVCLMRADHPALRTTRRRRAHGKSVSRKVAPGLEWSMASIEAYAALSHMVVSPQGSGPGFVDQVLAKHGLTRRIALRVPHFYSALGILGATDLVLTAPTALARLAPSEAGIVSLEPPLRLPAHSVQLVWHERFTHDRGHAWLRSLVFETCQAI